MLSTRRERLRRETRGRRAIHPGNQKSRRILGGHQRVAAHVRGRASDKVVAQVSNLLYRRLPACGCAEGSGATVMAMLCRLEIGDTAGWNLRYAENGRILSVALRQ